MALSGTGGAEIAPFSEFDPDPVHFREAMSRVGASVHIVATDGPAGLGGITATTATSITLDPAMMLFCIHKTSPSAARMIENGVFCINALNPAHQPLADIFAGRSGLHLEERFASGEWTRLLTGAPVLRNAAASFDCDLVEAREAGTHFVMIGLVRAVAYGAEGDTLAYVHRGYKTL
jgi:flavin reductase